MSKNNVSVTMGEDIDNTKDEIITVEENGLEVNRNITQQTKLEEAGVDPFLAAFATTEIRPITQLTTVVDLEYFGLPITVRPLTNSEALKIDIAVQADCKKLGIEDKDIILVKTMMASLPYIIVTPYIKNIKWLNDNGFRKPDGSNLTNFWDFVDNYFRGADIADIYIASAKIKNNTISARNKIRDEAVEKLGE